MAQLDNLKNINKPRSIFKIFWFIIRISWRSNKLIFIAAVLMTTLIVSLSFLNSYSFSQIINILTRGDATWQQIIPYLATVALLDYVPNILNFIKYSLTDSIDRVLRIELSEMFCNKIYELDTATIEQPEFQDLVYQVNQRGISGMVSINYWLFTLISEGTKVIFALIILFTLSKIGLLIITLSSIPIYIYESWRAKNLGKIFASQTETNRKISSRLGAFFSKDSLIEIKFYKIGVYFLEKIKSIRLSHHYFLSKDDIKTTPRHALANLFLLFGIIFSSVTIIRDVMVGLRPIGTLTFVWSTLWQFSGGLQSIVRSVGRLEEFGFHASKLINVLEMEPYISENKDGIVYDKTQSPTIEFKNVSFRYPGTDRDILKNINTIIDPSSEVAIVGLNGAGKTTLFRLLSRVYDPTEGEILVNGINLADYQLQSWRDTLGIMLQDYNVYQDETIRDNITFAHGNDNTELLEQVITETGVNEYVKVYETGIDQMIGKEYLGGVELSKGQKQKLVLARTLYQNHPVLILDEPTAAIDAVSEDTIFKALRENHTEQTRIIISHKFSNVRDADQIILIEHGTIIEQGTHDKLMKKKKGRYAEMFNLQAEGYK